MTFAEQVEATIAAQSWPRPSAEKRGRNALFPYVPVLVYVGRTSNPARGRAFSDRASAIACAERCIDAWKDRLRKSFFDPRQRATRRHYGLPEELPAQVA